ENYAIKTGIHPKKTTEKNIKNYLKQMKMLGLSYDYDHIVKTSDPSYYKWTQWLFGKFFENGLVERKTDKINWCPSCQTGIANEQVVDGRCERCKTKIQQKEVKGWFFKITKFADDLIKDLDKVDWPEATKKNQRNWIGKSVGSKIKFKIQNSKLEVEVFTTRPDTLFGATYLVLAPEHEILKQVRTDNLLGIRNIDEVKAYLEQTKNKTEMERLESKEKTGVKLEGLVAINPANGEEIPIFVADYVLGDYGTGAIMAVPAHDERDYEFATQMNAEQTQKNADTATRSQRDVENKLIEIRQVIAPNIDDYNITKKVLDILEKIKKEANKENIKFWVLGGLACAFYAKTIYRAHDDLDLIVKNKKQYRKFIALLERIGFEKIKEKKVSDKSINTIYRNKNNIEIDIGLYLKEFGMIDEDFEEDEKELNRVKSLVVSKKFVKNFKKYQLENRGKNKDRIDWDYLNGKVFTGNGILINSGQFNGMNSEEAKKAITEFVGGEMTTNYRLRDWSISRQRYWGCPCLFARR
ncbi:MAG: class I tRNA ligase family protein, partial [Xanthomonadaceae bacterium]|nr:class I tRNA ligase family protein [Rhodospirillaceae bacterium]NIA18075.1 class I tRNA ligase family protein [Xanthomonadaceae bacterium]